jgi:hypothetical protein
MTKDEEYVEQCRAHVDACGVIGEPAALSLLRICESFTQRNKTEAAPRADGTLRQAHYGSGRQPWDDIVVAGWGPAFAASSILKYLRRTKDPEHSITSARWYYAQLEAMADAQRAMGGGNAIDVINRLRSLLTEEEMARIK